MIFNKNTIKCLYHVAYRRINQPLANSVQYYLKNDNGRELSSWSDIDIKL